MGFREEGSSACSIGVSRRQRRPLDEAKRSTPTASGLTWQEVPGGWNAGQYVVRRLDRPTERCWQLEVARRGSGWQKEPVVAAHRTRSGAITSAKIYEMHRIGSRRLRIHFGVFLVTSVAWLIRSTAVNTSFGGFLLLLGLFGVALKSLANAVEVLDAARSTAIERDVDRLDAVERWLHVDSLVPPLRLRYDADTFADEPNIRVLESADRRAAG